MLRLAGGSCLLLTADAGATVGSITHRTVTVLLIREMERRRKVYWAWSEEEWLETVCADVKSFKNHRSQYNCRLQLIAVVYLLGNVAVFRQTGRVNLRSLARIVFGKHLTEQAIGTLLNEMNSWGYGARQATSYLPGLIAELLLANGSPLLADLTPELLETIRREEKQHNALVVISKALANLGILKRALAPQLEQAKLGSRGSAYGAAPEWIEWCLRWNNTSTLARGTRDHIYYAAQRAGRWLADKHPEISSPTQWTREIAAEYVAMIDRMVVGDYSYPSAPLHANMGKPLKASSKSSVLTGIRTFFSDLQEWGLISRRFNPGRAFETPPSIRRLISPDPRIIADEVWAKLLHAGLNLTEQGLPTIPANAYLVRRSATPTLTWYPLEMVRAITLVWLFAGLRSDEIRRLRRDCIRWQKEDVTVAPTDEVLRRDSVCYLQVPTNKTTTAFTKPVDPVMGEAIRSWEQVRPAQPLALDAKTGEMVHYLFSYRGIQMGRAYINEVIIPVLCHKSGVPEADARGKITSHRARSTLATQLYNAKQPMTLFELMEWLGHRTPSATQHYAKIAPTKLAKAYADADYFKRNVRTIEVLVDRDAVVSGAAARGEPWQYFDLGHGYCTYDFFAKCPHRMACARCDFYLPKGSTRSQMLEAKFNLQQMVQNIPLTDEERAAIEQGVEAMEKLCAKLVDVPTPAGPTPRELTTGSGRELPVLAACPRTKG